MATYQFQVNNGTSSEKHELELADDRIAVREGLKTAADLMQELPMEQAGAEAYWVEVRQAEGKPLLRIDVQATRGR